jgi:hypothetical protein
MVATAPMAGAIAAIAVEAVIVAAVTDVAAIESGEAAKACPMRDLASPKRRKTRVHAPGR